MAETYAALQSKMAQIEREEAERQKERAELREKLAALEATPEWKDWRIAQLERELAAAEEKNKTLSAELVKKQEGDDAHAHVETYHLSLTYPLWRRRIGYYGPSTYAFVHL
jgi:predicted nuclease with TOPRIM domain